MSVAVAEQRPVVRLKPKSGRRVVYGHPWVYANEVAMDAVAKALAPGEPVRLEMADGTPLGTALFNKRPLICARLISRDPDAVLDEDFLAQRLERAKAIRERLIGVPHYRLVHAEADGFPGTIVDRYGDIVVLQLNTAGIDRLRAPLLAALERVLAPRAVVLRNDSPAREMEGLATGVETAKGRLAAPIEVLENGAVYFADPRAGQKTGWFFDQRDNRAAVGRIADGLRVLDGYSFTGGFALQAALRGAREVVAIDRSQPALELAAEAARYNGVERRCRWRRGEVFDEFDRMRRAGERFDLVVVDPPAFVKSKKDFWQGLKGYRKLTRLAASLVAPEGYLMVCSCSHHVEPDIFAEQVRRGLAEAGRGGRVLRRAGAGADHPLHPWLPESAYLKAELLAVD